MPRHNESLGRAGRQIWEIGHGWDVVDAGGAKLGDVQKVEANYIVVSKGYCFPKERTVPVAAISNVEQECVYLSVARDELEQLDWDIVIGTPTSFDTATGAIGEEERAIDVPLREEHIYIKRHSGRTLNRDVPAEAFQETDIEIPLRAEEAEVTTRAVVREEVEIGKHIRQRRARVGETVHREELHSAGDESTAYRLVDHSTGDARSERA